MKKFEDNFWGEGDHGMDAILAALKEGRNNLGALETFMESKLHAEEEYNKKMSKAAKNFKHDDLPGMNEAMRKLVLCTNEICEKREEFITILRGKVLGSIADLRQHLETIKHDHKVVAYGFQKEKDKHIKIVQKAKENYFSKQESLSKLNAKSIDHSDPNAVQKHQKKVKEIQVQIDEAERYYKSMIENQKTVHDTWYKELRLTFAALQQLETKRLKTTKEILHAAYDSEIPLVETSIAILNDLTKAFDAIEVEKDIQVFIQVRATGTEIPSPVSYEIQDFSEPKEEE